MRSCSPLLRIAAVATATTVLRGPAAHADDVADFHQGKSITGDREFQAEADKLALEINLVDGETLQAMVEQMFQASRKVVKATRGAIGQR